MIAYYWSEFIIPVEDLEIEPEFSEERVLEVLEKGMMEQRSLGNPKDIKISEVTASCRYHQGQGGGGGRKKDGVNLEYATSGCLL